jgi:hypothetical protein
MEMKSKMMTTQYPENKKQKKWTDGFQVLLLLHGDSMLMLILPNDSNIAHCHTVWKRKNMINIGLIFSHYH